VCKADDDDGKIGRKVKAWRWREAALGQTSRGPNRSVPRPQRLLALQYQHHSVLIMGLPIRVSPYPRDPTGHDPSLFSVG
jgi:hypothetical protein